MKISNSNNPPAKETLTMIDVQTTGKTRAEETGRPERLQDAVYYLPQCDIVEEKDQLLVLADLPGAKGEDIDIKFEDGELTIHAKAGTAARPRACVHLGGIRRG